MTSNTVEAAPKLSEFCYKTYSLDHLETWIFDALGSEATPEEISKCIIDTLEREISDSMKSVERATKVLELIRGNL